MRPLSSNSTLAWATMYLSFLPRRKIFAVGYIFGRLLLGAELLIGGFNLGARGDIAHFIIGIAGFKP